MKEIKKNLKKTVAVLLLVCGVISAFLYVKTVSYPFVRSICKAEAERIVRNEVSVAMLRIRTQPAFQSEFTEYERNQDGEIVLVKAVSGAVNSALVLTQTEMQKAGASIEKRTIKVKTGAFTGSALLSEKGKDVDVNMRVAGYSDISLKSSFAPSGINNTLHRLYLTVKVTVEVLIPLKTERAEVTVSFVVSENVIAGRVPQTYVSGYSDQQMADNIFDLVGIGN
ncbi:MAG: sporulation protein YunB [Christensenellaceae bacterium]|nr:sporulation protein YunB [Christensenellaceae bacterium]